MAMLILILTLVVIAIGLIVFEIVSYWKVFEKAGKPGWAAIVPFYNGWVQAEIGGKPGWWGLIASLSFSFRSNNLKDISPAVLAVLGAIGLVAFVFYALISLGIAKNFGKSNGFGFLLILLPFVGIPILAFGDAKYRGAIHTSSRTNEDLKWIAPVNRSGLAIAAGYAGLFAIIIFPAPLALILGILALRDLKKHPTKFGKGRAWFGLIAGALGTLVLVIGILIGILHK